MISPASFIALIPEARRARPGRAAVRVRGPAGAQLPARHRARAAIWLGLAGLLVPAAVAVLVALPSVSTARGTVLTVSNSPPGTASAAPSAAVAAQVIAAYTRYFPALTAAEPQSGQRAEAALATYAAQPYLGHVLVQMAWYRAHGELAWGYLTPHVTSVQIIGSQAVVRDCQDASNAWLVSTVTGEAIPGSIGSARTYLIALLVRGTGGRWRLTFLAHLAAPCSPVPSPF